MLSVFVIIQELTFAVFPACPEYSCRVHSVDTKTEVVKILHFKQFYKHFVFIEDENGG